MGVEESIHRQARPTVVGLRHLVIERRCPGSRPVSGDTRADTAAELAPGETSGPAPTIYVVNVADVHHEGTTITQHGQELGGQGSHLPPLDVHDLAHAPPLTKR